MPVVPRPASAGVWPTGRSLVSPALASRRRRSPASCETADRSARARRMAGAARTVSCPPVPPPTGPGTGPMNPTPRSAAPVRCLPAARQGHCCRTITRHVGQGERDATGQRRLTPWGKAICGRRKETAERCFADARQHFGHRDARLRSLVRVRCHCLLGAAARSIRKIARVLTRTPDPAAGWGRAPRETDRNTPPATRPQKTPRAIA